MGLPRKGKTGSKSKSSKKTEGKPKEQRKPQPQLDPNKEAQLQLLPQERVLNVKPCWENIPDEQRVELLSVELSDLKLRAIDLADKAKKQAALEAQEAAELNDGTTITVSLEPGLDEIFEEGTRRLLEKSTWKLWQWPPEEREFFDADSFRQYAEEQRIDEELRKMLPRDEGKPIEKPAERALRERMAELLQKVHATNRQLQDNMQTQQTRRVGRRDSRNSTDQVPDQIRDSNIELITIILEALEKEHEYLYNAVLYPVTHFVCEMLPEQMRESTRTELFFDDLEKLPSMEVARICEWLTEKVDGFSSKTRAEPKDAEEEEEEEGIGDVDLFTLTEDRTRLVVNVKWLQHLQERLLGEDGHPRKVHEGEDPHRMGLVLEWVYGTIVSTAEKARDGAKRTLGMQPPTVDQAYEQLVGALQDMAQWEARARTAKELLTDMMQSRKEATELATKYDIRPDPNNRAGLPRHALAAIDSQEDTFVQESSELPDHAIIALLKREHLLTRAKLNALYFEHIMGERRLRSLKTQLRQGEPEFDRLKRELEEVKNQPRGLEGTFRTAAEMERHRAQLADAAIEEQLEVQTAFREHGARLQGIYDKRQRTEHEMVHREQEIKQLQGWAQTVLNLINKFEDGLKELGPLAALEEADSRPGSPDEPLLGDEEPTAVATARALTNRARDLTAHRQGIAKLRQHFSKDVRRQLYVDEDDRKFFNWVQSQLKQTEKRLEDGRAVLHHLEAQLINVACDDPGAAIGAQLALPLLQERLDARAQDFARQKAAQAEEDIIKMEEEKLERERSERERKLKQKQKAKDRVRSEKEKLAAEKEAAEKEARERSEEQLRLREQQSLAAREAAAVKREELKRAEEALMEARRQELLSEEDGYWRQRMDQQQRVEKLKTELAEQEELKGHSEDGTEDTSPSSATPPDDASDISHVDAPHGNAMDGADSAVTHLPMANGFHLPNGSANVDSDGFTRQHERRPSAGLNGRSGAAGRFAAEQPLADGFRHHNRGSHRSGSYDRYDGPANRGSSAEGRDRYPRPGGYQRDGSSDHSDQQDRFGPRRFNRDLDRQRDMGRGRRMHPVRDAPRPLPVARHPSANTVSASRGADGRIEIATERPTTPAAPSLVKPEAPAALGRPQPKVAVQKPTILPAESSPTSPLPLTEETAPPAAVPSVQQPVSDAQAAAQVVPAAEHEDSPHEAAPQHELRPAVKPSDVLPSPQAGPPSDPGPAAALPDALRPVSIAAPHPSNQILPESAPQSPSAVPATAQPAQRAQHAQHAPAELQQPQIPHPGPAHNAAQGPASEPGQPQGPLPNTPYFSPNALHQAPLFRPKATPCGFPGVNLPNGYAGPQQQQPTPGPQANLQGNRLRNFPHPQQQLLQHLHQQQQQQHHQQLARRQPDKPQMQLMPGQTHPQFHNVPQPMQVQSHAGAQTAPDQGQGSHNSPQGLQNGHQGIQNGPQGRNMPVPQSQFPGSSRSSSIGQKRPMPSQEPQHVPTHQMPPQQQQRGPPSPAGPMLMGSLPFNGPMHPSNVPPFIPAPNGMSVSASLPGARGTNSIPYSLMMPNTQRPSMTHMPLMTPGHMAGAKSGPMHHQGNIPYNANPYLSNMSQMPAPLTPSSSHPQVPAGPQQGPQQGPLPHPQQIQGGPSSTPPQRTSSSASSLPNGHIRALSGSGLGQAPASPLASKGSSTLRATAMPFVPGGMTQPASPAAALPFVPGGMIQPVSPGTAPAALQAQGLNQKPVHQLQSPSASAMPFYPTSRAAELMPGQLSNAEMPPGRPQPPHTERANADAASNQAAAPPQNPVPAFMTAILPQDVPSILSLPSRLAQPASSLASSSEPSVAPPSTPHPQTAPTPASQASAHTHRTNTNTAETSQPGTSGPLSSDQGRALATAPRLLPSDQGRAPEASSSSPQDDSPKSRWSHIAVSPEDPHMGLAGVRPKGSSPTGRSSNVPSALGRLQSRPVQSNRSNSNASAATQDADYARTDSTGSLRDTGVSERRASHAAAGTSGSLPRDSSASSFTSAPHRQTSGGRRKIVKRHGLVYEHRQDGMRRLQLVRGLSNMFGQYNCFLNVVIQSLWHLPAFRNALLSLPSALPDNGASPKDAAVLRALHNIFSAFSRMPPDSQQAAARRDAEVQSASADSAAAQQLQQQEEPDSAASSATTAESDAVVRQSISPDELREALSNLDQGQSPVEFELSEMHDAAEVLGEVFNCVHRAQLGQAAAAGLDPQLPQLVRVPRASSSSSLPGLATPIDPSSNSQLPSSMAQHIFGQKVQVPCPPDDVDSPLSKKARAEAGQWQQQQKRASASQQRQQAQQQQQLQAAAKRQSKDSSMIEMQHYWQYFHLVPAQAMRIAYDSLSRQGSFEAVLREADYAEAHQRSRQPGAAPLLDITLLHQPRVFTLALVWESAKVAEEAIFTTVDALQERIDLSNLFKGVAPQSNAHYALRSIICYFGHHYQAYALSEELDQWLLFDDTNIQLIGDWQDVKSMIRGSRLQPSVLFYERLSA